MKKLFVIGMLVLSAYTQAQVGIGTTSPNSTLDVRGSQSGNIQIFTTAYTATSTDYNLIFTGSSATTVTLPTAVGITGRIYCVKNASTNTSVLTIATTSAQTIDGVSTQALNNPYQTLTVISDGSNWHIMGYGLPSGSGTNWSQGGNAVGGVTNLGTTTAFALPFITNNTEKMRISSTGNVGIGQTTFSGSNPEKLYINSGTATNTALYATGDVNDYLQINIQNANNGNFASSDIVATANDGTSSTVYIDMGINSQGYSSGNSSILNGSNTAYLYATGTDFYIGNGAQNKDLIFFTNTGASGPDGAERMRITSTKMTVRNDLFPEYNNSFSLGSSTLKWTAVYATNGTIQTSDRRLKTNIQDLKYGLKEVLALQPVRYNWKTSPNSDNKIGLIAQDVRKIVPEVVVGDESKENIGMNYAELVPVLINAIKEQQQQIELLTKEVNLLKRKN
jgi:hypothetical protein